MFRVGTRLYRRGVKSPWPCRKRSFSARTVQCGPVDSPCNRVPSRNTTSSGTRSQRMRTATPMRSSKPPGVLEADAPHRRSQLRVDVEPASMPGRKSDVNDAMRNADLLAHSLIRSSFVPPAAIQELRNPAYPQATRVRDLPVQLRLAALAKRQPLGGRAPNP